MQFNSILGRLKLAIVAISITAALAGCASLDERQASQTGVERSAQARRYSVMDDWFWRSRYFDSYYDAAYSGYGVWHDPWLMWTLRSGRYGSFGHWQFDPFYSPWRGFGPRFGWGSFGFGSGWGHGYPYYPYSRYYGSNYGYRYPVQVRDGRGLAVAANSTESADRALELLRQSERRNAPDYGAVSGSAFPGRSDVRNWPMQNRQDRAILQMETPRRDDGQSSQQNDRGGLPSAERRESVFPSDMGRGRERDVFESSERRFEQSSRHQKIESRRQDE